MAASKQLISREDKVVPVQSRREDLFLLLLRYFT
jgi:hypothetical protein